VAGASPAGSNPRRSWLYRPKKLKIKGGFYMTEIRVKTEISAIYVKGTCVNKSFISEGNFEDWTHINDGLYSTCILFARHFKEEWIVDGITLHCDVREVLRKNADGSWEHIGKEYETGQALSNEDYQILVNSSDKNDFYKRSLSKPEYQF